MFVPFYLNYSFSVSLSLPNLIVNCGNIGESSATKSIKSLFTIIPRKSII
jgi:hypothetical protein